MPVRLSASKPRVQSGAVSRKNTTNEKPMAGPYIDAERRPHFFFPLLFSCCWDWSWEAAWAAKVTGRMNVARAKIAISFFI
jgi:hypothetical protein